MACGKIQSLFIIMMCHKMRSLGSVVVEWWRIECKVHPRLAGKYKLWPQFWDVLALNYSACVVTFGTNGGLIINGFIRSIFYSIDFWHLECLERSCCCTKNQIIYKLVKKANSTILTLWLLGRYVSVTKLGPKDECANPW